MHEFKGEYSNGEKAADIWNFTQIQEEKKMFKCEYLQGTNISIFYDGYCFSFFKQRYALESYFGNKRLSIRLVRS